jgi:saccharopine dehydrogenase-like NADP-dependent oxidoreductase
VLSCLPYHLNKNVASAAHPLGIHYFDLTEDVATTRYVRQLAQTTKGIMAPQISLAPGFIAIVGAYLAEQFNKVRSISLRVGALPQNPTGLLGYAFNWSHEGVVNQYLNDCEVIEEGVLKNCLGHGMAGATLYRRHAAGGRERIRRQASPGAFG